MSARKLMSLEDLRPASYNPRQIDVKSLTGLKVSMEKFGDISGIVWNSRTGNLTCGHQRFKALQEEHGESLILDDGRLLVPGVIDFPIRVVDWPLDMEMAANVAANAPTIEGEFTDGLGEVLDVIQADQSALFDALRFSELIVPDGPPAGGKTNENEVPPVPEDTPIKRGDMWSCRDHRIVCGDSTSAKDVEQLMGEQKAEMLFTDPPYGIAYEGGTKRRDRMHGDESCRIVRTGLLTISEFILPGGAVYCCSPSGRNFIDFGQAFVGAGFYFSATLIWAKNNSAFGHADYQWMHEAIIYGWREGAAHRWRGDRKQTTIWNISRPARSDKHPVMKPVELVERALTNSSVANDLVLDPFIGSGTSMIAAERLGRRCYGMEIEPRYVHITLQRWAEFTGKDPVRHDGVGFTALKADHATKEGAPA